MNHRALTALFALAAVALLAPPPLAAQSDDEVMRTPDGQPHISGIFTFRTLTPLERPAALEGRERLSLEEAAQFEASERIRLNRDLFDPITGAPSAGYQPRAEGGRAVLQRVLVRAGHRADRRQADSRSSSIRPNGRIPYTDEAPGSAAHSPAQPAQRVRGPLHRPQPVRPLHPRLQRRAADDGGVLQQQRPDHADPGLRGDLQRDGAQPAHHRDRRGSAAPRPAAVVGRIARPLGRRDVRRRDATTSSPRPACGARRRTRTSSSASAASIPTR